MIDIQTVRKSFPMITELALQEAIAENGEWYDFKAGDVIMDYGDYIRFVPLVVSGSVKVLRQSENGDELFLYYLNGGETCAMAFTCCMMHRKSEIRTIAEEDTSVISIPLKEMDDWMTRFSSWKNFVMLSYNNRFQELFNALDSIAFLKMDERLLRYLANKARTIETQEFNITHQEIARELNASREAISRLLKKLERKNLLELGRNKIKLIKSPDELEALV